MNNYSIDNVNQVISATIKVDHICSVNEMYATNRAGRRYQTKANWHMKEQILSQFKDINFKELCPWLTADKWYKCTITFSLKGNINKRDLDNMNKVFFDEFFNKIINIDDSRISRIHSNKCNNNNSDKENEYIYIQIEPTELN